MLEMVKMEVKSLLSTLTLNPNPTLNLDPNPNPYRDP
jgi:hypothetical protein